MRPEIPKTRKRPHRAHPKFWEVGPPPFTRTPAPEEDERRVDKFEKIVTMNRQQIDPKSFRVTGSREDLRRVIPKDPDGDRKAADEDPGHH